MKPALTMRKSVWWPEWQGRECRCEHRPQICADYWDSAGMAEFNAASAAAAAGSNGTLSAAGAAGDDPGGGGGGQQRQWHSDLPPVGKRLEVYPTEEACCQPGLGAFAKGCSLTSSLF